MKVLKSVLIVLWVLATTLFVVGALTPLDFRSKIIAYASFFISFNGAFALTYLLSNYVRLRPKKVIIVFIISLSLALTYYLLPITEADWRTQEILYRKKDNANVVIAFQMTRNQNLQFDHRIVKMTRITPFFDWIVELNNFKPGEDWEKVNEYINDLGLQEPIKP